MKHGEEDEIRRLLARLSFEDQTLWQKQIKPLEEYIRESSETPVGEEIKGKALFSLPKKTARLWLCAGAR